MAEISRQSGPPLQGHDAYVQSEIDSIIDIYTARFPASKLRAVVCLLDDFAYPGYPRIVLGDAPLRAEDINLNFIGVVEFGATAADAGMVTIYVSIPRQPSPAQIQDMSSIWQPSRRFSRRMASVAPMLFEYAKYQLELREKRRRKTVHHWRKLVRPHSFNLAQNPIKRLLGAQKPAILLGFHWLEVGGAESLAFDCVRYALRAGFRVLIVADIPALQRKRSVLEGLDDVRFIRLDRYLALSEWPLYLETLVIQENIRAIHIHHCTALYNCLPHLKSLFPDLHTIDSTHIIEHRDGGFARISAVWTSYIDIHHVISRELKTFYRDEFYRTNGVLLGRLIKGGQPQVAGFRLAPGKSSYTVTFIGRLIHQKRPFIVVEIMRRLSAWAKRQKIDLKFNIMGDGPYRDTCLHMVSRLGLNAKIRFHESTADVARLMEQTDILLLASANEGLALVCFEAIRHGAVPVSTDVGAQNELTPRALLTDPSPFKCVTQSVAIVQKLITDADFATRAMATLMENFTAIAAEPTAEDVLISTYQTIVQKAQTP